MRTTTFLERLHAAARKNESWLCVGLDPDPAQLRSGLTVDDFLHGIVDATRDLVCCYKPNIAFFEALGLPGQVALRALLVPAHLELVSLT